MDNGNHDLDVIIGKSRKGTEQFFGQPDFKADSFTAYWRDNSLLLILSGDEEGKLEMGEVVKGYLLSLPDGKVIASDSVYLLDEEEALMVKKMKKSEDIMNSMLPVHGDIGSGLSIPIYLTESGTAIILRILGEDVIDCREESVRELFVRKDPDGESSAD